MKLRSLLIFFVLSIITDVSAQTMPAHLNIIEGSPNRILKTQIESNTNQLFNDIFNSFRRKSANVYFTTNNISENGKRSFNLIWDTSSFEINADKIEERLLKTSDGYEIRNIPVRLDDGKEEKIVLTYNTFGNIDDIYFAVSEHQYKNMGSTNAVMDSTKINVIRNFLESYKTAYIKKDLSFIDMVMSDKALIVVGKNVKQSKQNNFKITDTGKHTLYNDQSTSSFKKVTKKQYMKNLDRVFKNNKSILVEYSDIEIIPHRKSGYESFYGVRLKQRWQSDNYSDFGLLFFVIEYRENNDALIWVRVWQDANTTSTSDQVGLGEILIQPK